MKLIDYIQFKLTHRHDYWCTTRAGAQGSEGKYWHYESCSGCPKERSVMNHLKMEDRL